MNQHESRCIIAVDAGETVGTITEGKIHVHGGDPADIAWGVKHMLQEPEKAKKWGENGRKGTTILTWKKAAEQTLQVYEALQSSYK